MAKSAASGLYNWTIGSLIGGGGSSGADRSAEATDEEFICVEYLDRQCDIFVRWAFKHELTLQSLAKVKTTLQKQNKHSLQDIDLLVKHLEHSGRVLVEKVSEGSSDDNNTIVKFVQTGSRDNSITRKEVALFSIQQTMDRIEAKINDCADKTQQLDLKIKTQLREKNRQGAMLSLQRRKMYETEQNRQQGMLNNLIQQKFTLEAAEETAEVFETLSLATQTNKALLSNCEESFDIDELKSQISEQENRRADLNDLFA